MDLSKLTKAQKQELLDQLRYELEAPSKSRSASDFEEAEVMLWEAIGDTLGVRLQSLRDFTTKYGAKKYRQMATEVRKYLMDGCGTPLGRAQLGSLYLVMLRCLCNWLRNRQIPITATSLCNSMGHIADVMDRYFPGYAAAHFLHRIAAPAPAVGGTRGGASSPSPPGERRRPVPARV